MGLVGRNGSGKTTLLKLIGGIIKPSLGRLEVGGRVASLLELGAGFHPEFTGRENVFLNGALHGLSRAEIRERMDEIVDFAGIGHYIDLPVRTYSAGMYMPLGFAVAAHVDADVLLLDEIFAVGDEEFQRSASAGSRSQAASRTRPAGSRPLWTRGPLRPRYRRPRARRQGRLARAR